MLLTLGYLLAWCSLVVAVWINRSFSSYRPVRPFHTFIQIVVTVCLLIRWWLHWESVDFSCIFKIYDLQCMRELCFRNNSPDDEQSILFETWRLQQRLFFRANTLHIRNLYLVLPACLPVMVTSVHCKMQVKHKTIWFCIKTSLELGVKYSKAK